MVFFITFLKALAACFITNAHYTEVYPIELIANGGLIGDILFFAVSGYCLYNIKFSFPRWYGKRLYRVYPPVILITLVYALLGFYPIAWENAIQWFIYPTHYHFVASIIVLYIAYYIVIKIRFLKEHLPQVMLVIAVLWLVVYTIFCDKTTYNIDNVYSPMIWFLFFESMLFGAYFRANDAKYRNHFSALYVVGLVVSFAAYFASKLLFSKVSFISFLQPINQILIFVLLYFFFRVFAGLDEKLERIPVWIKAVVKYIASITLEIYVVQYVIIDELKHIAGFPLNWFVLTTVILLSATALHWTCKGFYYLCDNLVKLISSKVRNG